MKIVFAISLAPTSPSPVRGFGYRGLDAGQAALVGFERHGRGRYVLTLPPSPAEAGLRFEGDPLPKGYRRQVTRLGPKTWAINLDRVEIPERGQATSEPVDCDWLTVVVTWTRGSE